MQHSNLHGTLEMHVTQLKIVYEISELRPLSSKLCVEHLLVLTFSVKVSLVSRNCKRKK